MPPLTKPSPTEGMKFTRFVRQVLGVTLTAAQETVCKIAFDGSDIEDLEPHEKILARLMFGGIDKVPKAARRNFVAVCGARAGKSRVFSAFRALHLALTGPVHKLAPGEKGFVLIVAPDIRLARQVLDYVAGACKSRLIINRQVTHYTADSITLTREDKREVVIECLPATRGGSALRGRSLLCAVLDECAFFRDEGYQVNDIELYRAVGPRIVAGGQLVVVSTPWAMKGLLYDLFKSNYAAPRGALACRAPTMLLRRGDDEVGAWVAEERIRDPDNARREYDAEFLEAGAEVFFDDALLDKVIDKSLSVPVAPVPGIEVLGGADFGFRSDSSALVVGHRQGEETWVAEIVEMRPEPGMPLKPSDVVRRFAMTMKEHGGTYVMADQHYRETIDELLAHYGFGFVPAPNTPADAFVNTRVLLRDGRMRLPNHPRLISQMREVTSKNTVAGRVSIHLPRWKSGGHGDLVSALVLMGYQAAGQKVSSAPVREGSKAWEAKIREERRQKLVDKAHKPWWKGGRGPMSPYG